MDKNVVMTTRRIRIIDEEADKASTPNDFPSSALLGVSLLTMTATAVLLFASLVYTCDSEHAFFKLGSVTYKCVKVESK